MQNPNEKLRTKFDSSTCPYGAPLLKANEKSKTLSPLLIDIGSALQRECQKSDFPYDMKMVSPPTTTIANGNNVFVQRGKGVSLGPSMLQERLATVLHIATTTSQIKMLMKRFDTNRDGTADIVEILSFAKTEYEGHKSVCVTVMPLSSFYLLSEVDHGHDDHDCGEDTTRGQQIFRFGRNSPFLHSSSFSGN